MAENEPRPDHAYDAVIIGAGPAGLTAAMYCGRQGLSAAVVTASVGGQAMWAHSVENFIGWELVSGPDLIERFHEHARQFACVCYEHNTVNAIVRDTDGFDVFTREGLTLHAKAIIIATGKAPNRLAIPGETELVGRGVSYCATCDAAFFVGKPVVVIGPDESAADAALQLADLGSPVTLVNRRPVVAPAPVLSKVDAHERITTRFGAKPLAIVGESAVTGLRVEEAGSEETIPCDAVFIELGAIAADEYAMGLVEVNDKGEIVVDKNQGTSTVGVYAAGDVTDLFGKQIITAAGQGARAAMAVARDLKRR